MALQLSKPAASFLIDKGFDPALGARPLRRAVEKFLEDPLAEDILRGRLVEGEAIEVIISGDSLKFRQKTPAAKET